MRNLHVFVVFFKLFVFKSKNAILKNHSSSVESKNYDAL